MKAKAYSAEGELRSEEVELPEPLFDGTVHEGVLHQVVTAIQANQRQGTASTKTWGTITGGSRKPWRQKGTGRARHGSRRSPIWRGGVVTFGPEPRDFDVRVPTKMKRLARQSALNARAREGNLLVVEPLELEDPRTKTVVSLLEAMEIRGKNVTILTNGQKRNVYLSARNIPDVTVRPWSEASALDLIRSHVLVVEEDAWLADDAEGTDGAGDAAAGKGAAEEGGA